ncbi:MAG TPA: hypothetical protein DCG04_13165, partial [Rhodospirillaceae bacterium]|nr:hypothetical protein [Rhodospirillaceae bacterium]
MTGRSGDRGADVWGAPVSDCIDFRSGVCDKGFWASPALAGAGPSGRRGAFSCGGKVRVGEDCVGEDCVGRGGGSDGRSGGAEVGR